MLTVIRLNVGTAFDHADSLLPDSDDYTRHHLLILSRHHSRLQQHGNARANTDRLLINHAGTPLHRSSVCLHAPVATYRMAGDLSLATLLL
ncbi:hypothetical protein LF1_57850 [Rubripirellula obstinata]|nr:hypothetical protein LF1_58160 [Rubripirellula obstinata]KAA1256899.1 hypothetical protein LF1_58070 [Rubripirellula obstinata]KAA1256930.1 hypothetical protein LF1_57850 [Rubripirellula obstinata]